MEPVNRRLICVISVLSFVYAASAQDRQVDREPSKSETATPSNGLSLTGKERSGRKWQDEQRIDNCKVPADKRGSKPRPDCLHSPPG